MSIKAHKYIMNLIQNGAVGYLNTMGEVIMYVHIKV